MFRNLHPKCSNLSCATAFEWLGGGKLFRFRREVENNSSPISHSGRANNHHGVEHFWLCEKCSQIFMLEYKPGLGVSIRLLWPELPPAEDRMHLLSA